MLPIQALRLAVTCSALLGTAGLATGCGNSGKDASDDPGGAGTDGGTTVGFCDSVLAEGIASVTLTGAVLVPAGAGNPTYCLVSGALEGPLNFQVALPESWNHKLLFLGGGGFDGEIPDIALFNQGALAAGYAIAASDSGHQGTGPIPSFDGSWALDDDVAVAAFGNSSTHQVLSPATAIVETRYGSAIDRLYFEGCSNGGREALIEAQRWPNDFDGIIARAPAYNFTGTMTGFQRNAQLVDALAGTLTPAKLTTLANAELSACDADDGVSDGIIARPEACEFDPTSLRCSGAADDTCLTDLELATLTGLRSATPLPYMQADSLTESAAWPMGHEADEAWWAWMLGNPAPSVQFGLQEQFIRYFVTKNPDEDSLATSLAAYATELRELSSLIDATNPDLSQFSERGGKLILWHGLADPSLSATGTAEYYEQAVLRAGGRASADEFMRYFTAAGVYHCGFGPGADSVDLLSALDSWVTAGTPPDDLVATRGATAGTTAPLTRPLCAYPSYPRYLGSGEPNLATSFSCTTP